MSISSKITKKDIRKQYRRIFRQKMLKFLRSLQGHFKVTVCPLQWFLELGIRIWWFQIAFFQLSTTRHHRPCEEEHRNGSPFVASVPFFNSCYFLLQSQRPLYTVEGGVSQLKVGCCHVHHSASSFVITYLLMGDYRGFHKWGTAQ